METIKCRECKNELVCQRPENKMAMHRCSQFMEKLELRYSRPTPPLAPPKVFQNLNHHITIEGVTGLPRISDIERRKEELYKKLGEVKSEIELLQSLLLK